MKREDFLDQLSNLKENTAGAHVQNDIEALRKQARRIIDLAYYGGIDNSMLKHVTDKLTEAWKILMQEEKMDNRLAADQIYCDLLNELERSGLR
jgi:cell division FtsZ-interacting protein ZapD